MADSMRPAVPQNAAKRPPITRTGVQANVLSFSIAGSWRWKRQVWLRIPSGILACPRTERVDPPAMHRGSCWWSGQVQSTADRREGNNHIDGVRRNIVDALVLFVVRATALKHWSENFRPGERWRENEQVLA